MACRHLKEDLSHLGAPSVGKAPPVLPVQRPACLGRTDRGQTVDEDAWENGEAVLSRKPRSEDAWVRRGKPIYLIT